MTTTDNTAELDNQVISEPSLIISWHTRIGINSSRIPQFHWKLCSVCLCQVNQFSDVSGLVTMDGQSCIMDTVCHNTHVIVRQVASDLGETSDGKNARWKGRKNLNYFVAQWACQRSEHKRHFVVFIISLIFIIDWLHSAHRETKKKEVASSSFCSRVPFKFARIYSRGMD